MIHKSLVLLVVLLIVVVYNRTHVRACEEVDKRGI